MLGRLWTTRLSDTCESADTPVYARDNFHWRPVVQSFPGFLLLDSSIDDAVPRLLAPGAAWRWALGRFLWPAAGWMLPRALPHRTGQRGCSAQAIQRDPMAWAPWQPSCRARRNASSRVG
jgi:hypothetical protein